MKIDHQRRHRPGLVRRRRFLVRDGSGHGRLVAGGWVAACRGCGRQVVGDDRQLADYRGILVSRRDHVTRDLDLDAVRLIEDRPRKLQVQILGRLEGLVKDQVNVGEFFGTDRVLRPEHNVPERIRVRPVKAVDEHRVRRDLLQDAPLAL